MLFNIKCKKFIIVAKLLKKTTLIESSLKKLGSDGTGVWEIYDKIRHKFPKEFEKDLIYVAEVRNISVHETPDPEKVKQAIAKADILIKIINKRIDYEVIHSELSEIIDPSNINDEYSTEIKSWIKEFYAIDDNLKYANTTYFTKLISPYKKHIYYLKNFDNDKKTLLNLKKDFELKLIIIKSNQKKYQKIKTISEKWENFFNIQSKTCTSCGTEQFRTYYEEFQKDLIKIDNYDKYYKFLRFIKYDLWKYIISFFILLLSIYFVYKFFGGDK